MKRIVEVQGIKIGEGRPKICVPIIGKNLELLIEEIRQIKDEVIDLVEWRIDYYEMCGDLAEVTATLEKIRDILGNTPLLVTFRSQKEGGEKTISVEEYVALNKTIIATQKIDLIDVELFIGDEVVKDITNFAHQHNVKVVMSNHDFSQTPDKEEIIRRLCKMQELNADLPKIAVMPQSAEDVLTLLSATNEMATKYASRPIITMSMAGMGIISRLAGEVFGSALTFGAVKTASAPGQIAVSNLNDILESIHKNQ